MATYGVPETIKDAILKALVDDGVDVCALVKEAISQSPRIGKLSDVGQKSAVQFAFRMAMSDCLGPLSEPSKITKVIDLAVECTKADMCPISTPLELLEDTFEQSVLDVCEKVFRYIEERLDVWTAPPFSTTKSPSSIKLPMLRFCNALTKRLSKLDTVFAGRILIFLASMTPLSDPSGVNRGSAFNLSNTTDFEEDESVGEAKKAPETNENDVPEDAPVDFVFYRQFWSMQKFFCDPNQCYETQLWESFTKCAKSVVTHFVAHKLDDDSVSVKRTKKPSNTSKTDVDKEITAIGTEEYFAKFLTSSRLFTLQLSDSQFRRQILVQLKVLFHYLTGTAKSKKKLELTTKQKDWITKIEKDVDDLLNLTPPEADKFYAAIKRIMECEEHWVEWKNEECNAYERASAVLDVKKRKRTRSVLPVAKKGKLDLGSAELTRLWNLSATNTDGCKAKDRKTIPSTKTFFEEPLMQLDPANDIEKAYWLIKDEDFCWKALRLLSQDRLHYIQDLPQNTSAFKTLEDYLAHALEKLAKEDQAASETQPPTDEPTPTPTPLSSSPQTVAPATTTA